MLIAGTILFWVPPVFVILYILLNYFVSGKKSICILVLGDVGRSPRMQYHALSFVKTGFSVELVGYGGSEIQEGLKNSESVSVRYLTEPPRILRYFPRLSVYILKVIWQSITLGLCLLLMPKCGHILLQNPPCIPALAVSWIVCWLRGSRLVIDWHNYGYSILELSLSRNHPLVRFAKWYEKMFGRVSSANICVTKAMKEDLTNSWGIRASVMYDRSPAMFKESSLPEKHRLFTKLSQEYQLFKAINEPDVDSSETAFTCTDQSGSVMYTQNRPALLVSSTSWTEDEDFGVLLDALGGDAGFMLDKKLINGHTQVYLQYKYYITVTKTDDGTPYRSHGYVLLRFRGNVVMKMGTQQQHNNQDRICELSQSMGKTEFSSTAKIELCLNEYEAVVGSERSHLPDIVCVITGKGPQKEFYSQKIFSLDWKHVRFCLPWLTPEDYPVLLGSANLGVCLHKSSSGLDLPMKVVDMFGCGLPVCAIYFDCLNELVKHDVNGLIFHDSQELSKQIQGLLEGFPSHQDKLQKYRNNLATFQSQRWQECWERDVLPLFTDSSDHKRDS